MRDVSSFGVDLVPKLRVHLGFSRKRRVFATLVSEVYSVSTTLLLHRNLILLCCYANTSF